LYPLGAYVMERACRTRYLAAHNEAADSGSRSRIQRAVCGIFIEEARISCGRTGTEAQPAQLELTESATLTGVERTAEMMRRLKSKGISVAMDDFGTGYSCLSYFAEALLRCAEARSVLRQRAGGASGNPRLPSSSILLMAHNLHMKVIVEGSRPRNSWS